jgi:AraC-like DNA-binding protein
MSRHGFGRGVLRPEAAAGFLDVRTHPPAADLAGLVDFYWNPRWDLRGREPYEQKVLAHPNVHLVFEPDGPLVYGVQRSLFVRRLAGAGQVLGVKFRPGAFRPFTAGPVAGLMDRAVPAAGLLGAGAGRVGRRILALDDLAEMAALADGFLRGLLPPGPPDPRIAEVSALVEAIAARPQLFRVDQLAEDAGMPVRRLQRLFAEYVGAPPKHVLRRARLHEAAARADDAASGAGVDWAALAADLGYSDQAHLTRDFTAAVGAPPGRYAGGGDAGGR